ncbi:hypothetical protein DWU98_02770 [Dyella monticola]|uniref:DUF4013 domain-containing protein n=1 Tax=Dyella monticola TaxID=1927958 RepID=A0A370X9J1_9GAMM|nr:hypothetical protein [Dyella monticola]RDS84895.1 hypothetical protein DWU98_02770 [Dyella monticola]
MAIRSVGASAGFGWLSRGISMGFRHPKPLFGGAVIVALAALIPVLIMMPMQYHLLRSGTPPPSTAFGWIMAIPLLIGLLLLPLYAGYLQLADAAERGLTARAGDVIKPYREGKTLRLIGYGVAMMVIYVAMLAIVIALAGGSTIAHWYMQVLTAQANHQLPPTALPDGFGLTMLLLSLVAIFMMGFYSIGLGQVTLSNRSVFGAIGDGIIGTLKNVLPLLMLVLGLILTWIAVGLCLGLVLLVLALIGKLIGVLVFVLIVPLYIALFLVVYSAMFGVMYHLWRDVCSDDSETGMAEAMAA